jgi:hypothetical protein
MMGGDYAAARIDLCTEKLTFACIEELMASEFCI